MKIIHTKTHTHMLPKSHTYDTQIVHTNNAEYTQNQYIHNFTKLIQKSNKYDTHIIHTKNPQIQHKISTYKDITNIPQKKCIQNGYKYHTKKYTNMIHKYVTNKYTYGTKVIHTKNTHT